MVLSNIKRAKEKIRVKLLDGSDVEVDIYKYITLPEKYEIIKEATKNMKVKGQDVEMDASLLDIIPILVRKIWADTQYKIEDIDGNSLNKAISERVGWFLGDFGFSAEVGHNQSS